MVSVEEKAEASVRCGATETSVSELLMKYRKTGLDDVKIGGERVSGISLAVTYVLARRHPV